MNNQPLPRKTWLALSLLAMEYTLLGWYLGAHHVFWVMGTFVAITTLIISWKSNPLTEALNWLIKQQVFVVVSTSFFLSLVVAMIFVEPILLSLIPLPLITLLYALLEMQVSEFKKSQILFWSMIITTLGLGLGEAIDLVIVPSMRY
jgi:hypothetical protein